MKTCITGNRSSTTVTTNNNGAEVAGVYAIHILCLNVRVHSCCIIIYLALLVLLFSLHISSTLFCACVFFFAQLLFAYWCKAHISRLAFKCLPSKIVFFRLIHTHHYSCDHGASIQFRSFPICILSLSPSVLFSLSVFLCLLAVSLSCDLPLPFPLALSHRRGTILLLNSLCLRSFFNRKFK